MPSVSMVASRSSRPRRALAAATMLVVVALAVGIPAPASATSTTFVPVADAYTRADKPSTNYGSARSIGARTAVLRSRKSFLRFDVRVPAGTSVTRATLRLYAITSSSDPGVAVRSVADTTWNESTITDRTAPATGTTVARAASYADGTYVSFDVSPMVKGPGPISVAVTSDSSRDHTFASREDAAHQPQLVVETAASPPVGPVLFGVAAEGVPWSMAELDLFTASAGKAPGLVMWYQDFAHFPDFDPSLSDSILARGAQPMLTWEPWDYTGGVDQPQYGLGRIIDGTHDAHIRRWATQIKAWNKPLLLRFAHEMNGSWNSWSEGVNGNLPGQYVAAFRHVHDVFAGVGVGNVTWVWSPNVVYSNSPPLAPFYPGDAYVDRVALDGYNWGSHFSDWQAWLSFEEIFGPGLAQLRSLTDKPVMVGEMASTENGGNKAAWIADAFAALKNHPEIIAFTWFNHDKETDWRIQSSAAAQSAFASAVRDPYFQGAVQ